MKKVNLWKTLFFSVLTVAAFTGCSDDDSDDGGGIPSITVNGGNKTATVAVALEGGETEAVTIESSGDWTVTFSGDDVADCEALPATGGRGTTSLKFELGSREAERTITATVTTSGSFEGIPITDKVTIAIRQTDGTVPTSDALYSENCGTDVEQQSGHWPYTDQFEGWTRGGTLDQSGVTYNGSSASVRNSGQNYAPADDQRVSVSDAPYVYFAYADAWFGINDINIGSNTNFTLTFTALDQTGYTSVPTFSPVTSEAFDVTVSTDGGTTYYAPLAFTARQIGTTQSWYECMAEFKLPADVSTDKISIRFSSYHGGDNNQLRIDDFNLYEGGSGDELQEVVATSGTISQITEVGQSYTIENATVVGTYKQGFVMQDATGAILVYMGSDAEEIPAEGSTVSVSGTASMYGGTIQLASPQILSTAAGSMPTLTPTEVTAENIAEMMTAPKVTYVKMTGTLSAGSYVNLEFLFETEYTGTLSSPNDDLNVSALDGQVVDVEGWFVNNGSKNNNGTYFTVVARSVTANETTASGSFTTTPTAFAATDPEPQVLNFTANEAAGTVKFEITGANADKFTYSDATASTVTVKAVGNNESDAAYTAELNLLSVDGDVLATVALKQSGVSSGAGYTLIDNFADITAGTYYMSGFSEEYQKTEFAPYSYHVWAGTVSSGDLVTVGYEFADGNLTINPSATGEAALITLEAVSGSTNTYYIKSGDKYLKGVKDDKRGMGLVDTSDGAEWTFEAHDKGGIKISNPYGSNTYILGTAGASSNLLRSYKDPAASLTYGVCFFKAN